MHPFWQNLFYRFYFVICLASISWQAYSEDNQTLPPGIIESFERLLTAHKDQFEKSKNDSLIVTAGKENLSQYKSIKFQTSFIQNIILHSDDKFYTLAKINECKFLSVMEANLLKTTDGLIEKIPLIVTDKNNFEKKITLYKEDFFDQIFKIKCLANKDYATLFNDSNFLKSFSGIKFTIPKNINECRLIHKEWVANDFTPYICEISQKNKKITKTTPYVENVSLLNRIYIQTLCNSLNDDEIFCSKYLKNDIWSKIINSEAPTWKMSFKCQQMFNKLEPLTDIEIKNCASKLSTNSKYCETNGSKDFPSYFPLQDCETISNTLVKSKLITNYHDCPGNVENEALTNIHRIVNHFSPRKIITSKETCNSEASYSFAKLNFEIKNEIGWPLKVCYQDKLSNTEKCSTYIPGSRPEEPLSEDNVISKILYLQKGAPAKTVCKIVGSKTYNPVRSEYKFGCFIVNSTDVCSTMTCEKKVIWDNKIQSDIKFIGKPIFDYFPTTYKNERYSFTKLHNEIRGTQERMIRNMPDMKFYLDSIESSIVHGIGCAEDLLPEIFPRLTINQCKPLPFIVDGHMKKGEDNFLVVRLSIDDLHTPRFISWPNLFNSVSAYQEIHPLNTWTLYGIKK